MEELPPTKHNDADEEIMCGLQKMGNKKACGPDNIPADLFKHSPLCATRLCEIISRIWATEEVPEEFACASFVMLFKFKGPSNDPAKYRCIDLLNHDNNDDQ